MSDYSEKAMEYFKQGYNCTQSVVAAFSDKLNVDFKTAIKLASSFGGGMSRLREVCGAVSGMFIIAGLLYGYDNPDNKTDKIAHYKLIQDLATEFKKANGSIICRELLGLGKGADSPIPYDRTKEYYSKRPCIQLVGMVAEIIENYIIKTEEIKMKIAAACEGNNITQHFGHCENFIIFDVQNNKISESKSIQNPGHRPGFLPNFLNEQGVNVIISGGMGGGAIDIFNELNIEVITGATGDAKAVAEMYLSGKLKSTGSVCHEHQHKDECGNN